LTYYKTALQTAFAKELYDLGLIYFEGKRVPKNIDKAKECFRQAKQNGEDLPDEILNQIEKYLHQE
jgi:TPR repeat protein